MALPKPPRRGPKPRQAIRRNKRPIARRARPRRVSERPSAVEEQRLDDRWRDKVREKSPGLCQWCGIWLDNLGGDCHHVFGKLTYPQLRHVVANGLHLHRFCHEQAHKYPVLFKNWFKRAFPSRWRRLRAKVRG